MLNKKNINSGNTTYLSYPDRLNSLIQSLNPEFINNFLNYYHVQSAQASQILNKQSLASQLNQQQILQDPGKYLLLLAKIYLYNNLPKSSATGLQWKMYESQSKLLLAYFYFKIAAQRYENSEAYYYLGLLDYYKITPHQTFVRNLESQLNSIVTVQGFENQLTVPYLQLLEYLKYRRFTQVENNLFLSSLFGHNGAQLVLANMNREGIGMEKNCTTSLSYYLSVIKNTYVDFYEFKTYHLSDENFEKELYYKTKINFNKEESVMAVSQSQFFDTETIGMVYQIAENYYIGRKGFQKDYVKAAELFTKLADQDHKNSMVMLGLCYFKGQGVPLNRKKAKKYFQDSKKSSMAQTMLIVMDFFEIQSKGNRQRAIKKMKEIHSKKKDSMNSILKYLFGSLIIKGEIKGMKVEQGIPLVDSAAGQGHLMAKIMMGILFTDGIDISSNCNKAISYFAEQAIAHPFYTDKFYLARKGLKNGNKQFALIKYLQLTLIGQTNSFINALYVIQTEHLSSLGFNENSWNIKMADNNILFQKLRKLKIVPDMYSYLLKQYNFLGKNLIKYSTLQTLLSGSPSISDSYLRYIRDKVVKVCAITKSHSLMNFYEYKRQLDYQLLSNVANGFSDKLHVLQARFLLGQYHHIKSWELLANRMDNSKEQQKAIQEYKRAAGSHGLGRLLFIIQQILHQGMQPQNNKHLQLGILDDFLTFVFVLIIIFVVLYYQRSRRLDQIHQKQLQKMRDEQRIRDEQKVIEARRLQESSSIVNQPFSGVQVKQPLRIGGDQLIPDHMKLQSYEFKGEQ